MADHKKTLTTLDILSRLSWGESEDIEFKSAKGGVPLSLWETYSAMANTKGGVIFLGVENNGDVSGIKDAYKIKKSFWDTLNNRTKVSANLLENGDVQEIDFPDGKVIAIRVPRASRYQRPVFLEQNPLKGTYRRDHEGDYHCSEQEVSRMLADRSEESVDSRILEHFSILDLDSPSLQQYRQRLASHKPAHPWLSEDEKGLLIKIGGWKICRNTRVEGVTVAGMLMFGRDEALREALPQYWIDYREKFSEDPQIRWTDRMTMDGTWSGNLFQFYLKVLQKLAADLKLPFQLDTNLFRKGETVVHEAIREALVNALIHADYLGQGGVVIEKYKDRFEFSNPGSFLISLDQILEGNVSECRNKSLQLMFFMMGAAEKAGSGIDKIRQGWRSQHWRSPIVNERMKPDRVLWTLPMMSLIPDESLARLKQRFGTKFERFTPLEVQALVTADLENGVDNARMRQITSKHSTDITKLLQKLVGKKILIQDGQGRGTRYRLPSEPDSLYKGSDSLYKGSDSLHKGSDSLHKGSDSLHKGSDSLHKGSDSLHKGSDSLHKGSDSLHKGSDSLHKGSDSLHKRESFDNDLDQLMKIAEPGRERRRLSTKEMESILLRICENRWLTRRKLAELLNRNEEGLRSRFLSPMVEHGLLCLRYPDKPNRVDQAYTKNAQPLESLEE